MLQALVGQAGLQGRLVRGVLVQQAHRAHRGQQALREQEQLVQQALRGRLVQQELRGQRV